LNDSSGATSLGTVEYRKRQRRRQTFNEPGDAHELTFSCYRRFQFLKSDRTCQWLAEAIDEARTAFDLALWAYVFMPEHVHIIVYPRRLSHSVGDFRQAIKEPVGRKAVGYLREHAPEWLPRITRRRGQRTERLFWQSGGGFDRNIKHPKTLLSMIDYIHLNPVRRGLVTRARDWLWSSARWFEGNSNLPLIPDPISPAWINS
jgi:putative transposase